MWAFLAGGEPCCFELPCDSFNLDEPSLHGVNMSSSSHPVRSTGSILFKSFHDVWMGGLDRGVLEAPRAFHPIGGAGTSTGSGFLKKPKSMAGNT